MTNAVIKEQDHVPAVDVERFGRLSGCETDFWRKSYTRLYHIRDVVSQFWTAAGASGWDALFAGDVRRGETWLGAHFRPVTGVHLGDGTWALAAYGRSKRKSFASLIIYFHRGALDAVVGAEGAKGTFTMADVVSLARMLDTRMAARNRTLARVGNGAPLDATSLKSGNLPGGFAQSSARSLSNAELTKITRLPAGLLADLGRVTGYETTYDRRTQQGTYYVHDEVHRFRTARGAEIFDALNVALVQGTRHAGHFRLYRAVRIGDYALAYSFGQSFRGRSFSNVDVYFRRGNLSGYVEASDMPGPVRLAPVFALARIIDQRFKAWLGRTFWPAVPAAATTVPFLTLGRQDLGAGYRLSDRFILTNAVFAAASRIPKRALDRHGRIWGFTRYFTRGSSKSLRACSSTATAFVSPSGATWGIARARDLTSVITVNAARVRGLRVGRARPLSVPSVGAKSRALTRLFTYHGHRSQLDTVVWRRGVYEAEVDLGGPPRSVTVRELERLARIQDSRIRRFG